MALAAAEADVIRIRMQTAACVIGRRGGDFRLSREKQSLDSMNRLKSALSAVSVLWTADYEADGSPGWEKTPKIRQDLEIPDEAPASL